MTMVGEPGTRVYAGDGPMCDGPPYHRLDGNPEGTLPMLVVRREGTATTFSAVHEPYEGPPRVKEVVKLGEDSGAMGIIIRTAEFTDYLCTAFDDAEHTFQGTGGQAVVFSDFAYIRLTGGKATVCGKVKGFRVQRVEAATINGQPATLASAGNLVQWGQVPNADRTSAPQTAPAPQERAASVHTWFSPEEVHLSAGGQREIQMHPRCVGDGQVRGQFRISAPAGLRVEPTVVPVPSMDEDQERVVNLKVFAAKDVARALHEIRFVPEDGLAAAPVTLLASVGVVITEDRVRPRRPRSYFVARPSASPSAAGRR